MAVNKVEVNGETKLDLTQDTVTPENLLSGATAHNAAGEQISGAVAVAEAALCMAISCPIPMAVRHLEHYPPDGKMPMRNTFMETLLEQQLRFPWRLIESMSQAVKNFLLRSVKLPDGFLT